MLVNPQLLMLMIPQITQAVSGASIIFAPIMSVFGFAILLLAAAWLLSRFNPTQPVSSYSSHFYGPNHYHQHLPSNHRHTHPSMGAY